MDARIAPDLKKVDFRPVAIPPWLGHADTDPAVIASTRDAQDFMGGILARRGRSVPHELLNICTPDRNQVA